MVRTFALPLSLVLAFACTTETTKPTPAQPSNQTKPAEPAEPASQPTASPPTPAPDDAERLHVTAEQATTYGLPSLPFSLVLGDSGLSGGGGSDGDYLTLSSPPGGTLMLRAYPALIGDDLKALVGKRHPEQGEFIDDKIELLGVGRPALTWVRGESLGRSSFCAFIVGPPGVGVGGPALLLELEVSAKEAGCAESREALGPVLESLRFD